MVRELAVVGVLGLFVAGCGGPVGTVKGELVLPSGQKLALSSANSSWFSATRGTDVVFGTNIRTGPHPDEFVEVSFIYSAMAMSNPDTIDLALEARGYRRLTGWVQQGNDAAFKLNAGAVKFESIALKPGQ